MKNNIVRGIKGGLAGLVLAGSALLGGCGELSYNVIPNPKEFSSESIRLPQIAIGWSGLASAGVNGGVVETVGINENGRWVGARTTDYCWSKDLKLGEAIFRFPQGCNDYGFRRSNVETLFGGKVVGISYRDGNKEFCEDFSITASPISKYAIKYEMSYVRDIPGQWTKEPKDNPDNLPRVQAFYVEKDNTLKPIK